MGSVLIKNGRVWDGNRFFEADVLTRDSVIARIGENITEPADFVFDAEGKIVSAGLVDAHVHIRGLSSERFGIQGEMSCLPFGVTAAANAGGGRGDKTLLEAFGLKTVVFPTAVIRDNRPKLSGMEETIARFGDRAVGIKVYFDTTQSEVRDISPLAEVCDFAKDRGLRVMVHCSHSPTPMAQILATLNPGDILTHAFHGAENNAGEDGFESMKSAKKRGVIIDAGFAGHIHTDFAVLREAVTKGVLPDTISTDITRASAYKRGGRYGLTMCMSMARTAGMEEADIFRAVTSTPAAVLGKGTEWGTLKEGGCADIAVLEYGDEGFDLTDKAGNRLANTEGYCCVLTVADGDVVWRK